MDKESECWNTPRLYEVCNHIVKEREMMYRKKKRKAWYKNISMNPKIPITNLSMYENWCIYHFSFYKRTLSRIRIMIACAMCLLIGSCNSELSYVNVSMWTWIGYSTPYAIWQVDNGDNSKMQHHMQTIIKTKENQKEKTKVQMFYTTF